jgi:hypothetical protein
MSRSPPLRFLVLLLAGWTGIRTAWLATGWWAPAADAGGRPQAVAAAEDRTIEAPRRPLPASLDPLPEPGRLAAALVAPRRRAMSTKVLPEAAKVAELAWALTPAPASDRRGSAPLPPGQAGPAPAAPASRWSFATWSFLREGDAAPLAAGGLLGGSQAGARIAYRLNEDRTRPLALTARLTSPLRRPEAAEAAVGIDWQPLSRAAIHLLSERRQRLGREGRSAFGLTVYGGVSDAPLGPLRVEAYAQAGMVGLRSRDLFGDGALRLSRPVGGRGGLGLGAWAAAQPGVARLDLGPQASFRLPLAGRNVAVAVDWRFRVAGDARPGSGPTLTVGTDF